MGISLPSLPILPPVPSLPSLPDLPSLPRIVLPNLPPPPKLPKLFGAVSASLKIFGLLTKIQCFMEKTMLIPEDHVGMTIAQRTDRQGTLPFDFLSLQFPQIAIPSIREIVVSTHVNFELKSDFIAEYARASVAPINRLTTDFAGIPGKIGPDINISTPPNINIAPLSQSSSGDDAFERLVSAISTEMNHMRKTENELMDVETFTPYLRKELLTSGLDVTAFDRAIETARYEADELTTKMYTDQKQGFSHLRKYLEAEQADTHELEKSLERLQHKDTLLSNTALPLAEFVSLDTDMSTPAMMQYKNWQNENMAEL